MRKPTHTDRTAATERVRLIALLTGSNTPNSKALARIVAARLLAILERGAGDTLASPALDKWADLARLLAILERGAGDTLASPALDKWADLARALTAPTPT